VNLHTREASIGGVATIVLDGVLDLASVGDLRSVLTQFVGRHAASIVVVDLDAVNAIDDSALGVLLGAAAAAREAGGDLELVCTNDTLRGRLSRTRLDRAITVKSTIA
jgi:anti-anti-sigma factor